MDDRAEIAALKAQVEELRTLLLLANDATVGLAGILGRALVDAGVANREGMANAIERRAGLPDDPDHNAPLLAFARAIRMNFPGGRFEVIEGGTPVDSGSDTERS